MAEFAVGPLVRVGGEGGGARFEVLVGGAEGGREGHGRDDGGAFGGAGGTGEGGGGEDLHEGASADGGEGNFDDRGGSRFEWALVGDVEGAVRDVGVRGRLAGDRDVGDAEERVRPVERGGDADGVRRGGKDGGEKARVVGGRQDPVDGRLRLAEGGGDLEGVEFASPALVEGSGDGGIEGGGVVARVVGRGGVAVDGVEAADGVPGAGRVAVEALLDVARLEVAEAFEEDAFGAWVPAGGGNPDRHGRPDLPARARFGRGGRGVPAQEDAGAAALVGAAEDMRVAVGAARVGEGEEDVELRVGRARHLEGPAGELVDGRLREDGRGVEGTGAVERRHGHLGFAVVVREGDFGAAHLVGRMPEFGAEKVGGQAVEGEVRRVYEGRFGRRGGGGLGEGREGEGARGDALGRDADAGDDH